MKTIYVQVKNTQKLIDYISYTASKLSSPDTGLTEKHHIVPKSFIKNNFLVELSHSSHVEAHKLLAEAGFCYPFEGKMESAYELMARVGLPNRVIPESQRVNMSISALRRPKRTLTETHKKNLSRAKKGKLPKGGRPEVKHKFLFEGKQYNCTIKEMCSISGSSFSNLYKVVKGTRKSSKGVKRPTS